MIKKISILCVAILLASCSNESTENLIDDTPPETITYNDNIRSIINNNCISCHGTVPANGAPMSLTTYDNVVDAIANRGLLDRIQRNEGQEGLMPLGGPKLPQNTINIILQWHAEGMQE